jgi:hypothetical protein
MVENKAKAEHERIGFSSLMTDCLEALTALSNDYWRHPQPALSSSLRGFVESKDFSVQVNSGELLLDHLEVRRWLGELPFLSGRIASE